MAWFYAVIESRHELQNPTPEKIRLLGERLQLEPDSHVLDIASGRGGPAIVLAGTFGLRITCVEQAQEFVDAARRRTTDAGVDQLIELVHADARGFALEHERYDAALCLGASFVRDGLAGTLRALTPSVRRRGFVAVGEPYWRTWPLPEGFEPGGGEDFVSLPETIRRFEQAGLTPVTLIDASRDDWDRYETLHWLTAEEWLAEHPDDPDSAEIRARIESDRERYLSWTREFLGWAIVAARKH